MFRLVPTNDRGNNSPYSAALAAPTTIRLAGEYT